MFAYILRRLLLMIPTLIGITFLVFMLIALSPGGIGAAMRVSGGQMEASSRALREAYLDDRYGLDDPPVVQYVRWLGRVSPIKFGGRDQVDPTGEFIQSPKALKPPPRWEDLTDALPVPAPPEPFAFAPGTPPDERARVYRRQANVYANARQAMIVTRTAFELALERAAEEQGLSRVRNDKGRIRHDLIEEADVLGQAPNRAQLLELGDAMIDAYGAAATERAQLAVLFEARPFPRAGIGLLPGLWLSKPDFGVAFSRARPVLELISEALPVTILLNLIAVPIIYFIAIPCGLLAAVRSGRAFDRFSGAIFIALWSFPIPLAGVLAIGYLANNEYLGWFPVSGIRDANADAFTFLPSTINGQWHRGYVLDMLWHVVLPVMCLVYGGFAVLSKQTRAAMLDNFNMDYVRTAKAKGVAKNDIVMRHVFRNSLLPLITMFVSIFPAMLAGSVVIEQIFSVPGMGRLTLDAIFQRDRELLLANTLMISAVNLLALLLADILYAMADPRITYE